MLFTALVAAALLAAAPDKPATTPDLLHHVMVGGFMVRPAGDKDVQEAAQQAVALLADPKYLGAPAKLVKVKEAASQIVAGRNYRLTLDLTVKGKPASVSVVLYQPLKGAPKITKFKKN